MFTLTETDIAESQLKAAVENEHAGAICTFDGRVRNHNDGKAVSKLSYEAYAELAEKEGNAVIAEALKKFNIVGAAAAHRTGDLAIGDVAVFVAVSAAHRDDAFKACRYIIDEIKLRLPIWKKETYVDGGSVWVNCQSCASHAHKQATGPGQHSHEVAHASESTRS